MSEKGSYWSATTLTYVPQELELGAYLVEDEHVGRTTTSNDLSLQREATGSDITINGGRAWPGLGK